MPFSIAVCGDSILWGVGLQKSQKIHELVARKIAEDSGTPCQIQHFAQTGAKLVLAEEQFGIGTTRDATVVRGIGETFEIADEPGRHEQETPHSTPSILRQVELIDDPEAVDLIIVNGGANDVGIQTFLDPCSTREAIAGAAERHCHGGMLRVLRRIGERCPNARVMVLDYYPVFSTQSDIDIDKLGAVLWVMTGGIVAAAGGVLSLLGLANTVADVSSHWVNYSWQFLGKAVADANAEMGNRFRLASGGFGKDHAMFAPSSRLFGLEFNGRNFHLERDYLPHAVAMIGPVDSRSAQRRGMCNRESLSYTDRKFCQCASAGHPSPTGAIMYQQAILSQLKNTVGQTSRPAAKIGVGKRTTRKTGIGS
jgi:lysophospholipase L1-like esterase